MGSEILILGGDIRSRSWLNIGDSYGMYNNFALYSNYRYWILVDAWVKKDKHLEIQKNHLDPMLHFLFPKCSSFFTRRFSYILGCYGPRCGTVVELVPASGKLLQEIHFCAHFFILKPWATLPKFLSNNVIAMLCKSREFA